jgi:dienelactone hydrolase
VLAVLAVVKSTSLAAPSVLITNITMRALATLSLLFASLPNTISAADRALPAILQPHFEVPTAFQNQLGTFRFPLLFEDGTRVTTADLWPKRRAEILQTWTREMGAWPPLLQNPRFEILREERRENFAQQRVRVPTAPDQSQEGWLLIPDGEGPFPAALVVFYEPETSTGLNADEKHKDRDYALQLTRRGFVTLSIGTPGGDAWNPALGKAACQPLSYHAYVAANCWQALALHPKVDRTRIGVIGHSYGGKWALFAAALWEKFACAVVSDPGIVWDEARSNVNYWEPWYLGLDSAKPKRKPGVITPENPRTGAYARLVESGHDLTEIHALICPRPFLVSGGSEDSPQRWIALNHAIAVNDLLGFPHRVGMTNRPNHSPSPEANAVVYAFFEHFLAKRP